MDTHDKEIDQMPKTEIPKSISEDNQATSIDTSSINSTKLSDVINDQVEEVTLMETSNETTVVAPTEIVKEETEELLQKVNVTDEQKNVEKDVPDSNISEEIKEQAYVLTEQEEISKIVEKISEAEPPSSETIVDNVPSLYEENRPDIETVVVSKEEIPSNFPFAEECSKVSEVPEKLMFNNDNESLKEDVILCATTKEVDQSQQEVEKVTVADEEVALPDVPVITTDLDDDDDKKKIDQSLESGNFSLANTTGEMENSVVDDALLAANDDKNLVDVNTIASDRVEVDESMLIDDSKKELTEDGTFENDMITVESNQMSMINSTKDVINYTNCDGTGNTENISTETSVTAVCDENNTRVTANITSCELGDSRYGSETDESLSMKPKKGSFSLGVPGLSFSSQNVRVANDGTKLVQIHQSQITPAQLQALQANPNIKVVFRHIPSGKSFTKPPKNLFNTLGKSRNKRKSENLDDSVYNFDDDYSSDYGATARSRDETKFARYHPYNSNKRRRPGRPRTLPESNLSLLSSNKSRISSITSQVRLNDVLVKLNKPTATKKLKVRISQVTIECLEKMELNPDYALSVITKEESEKEESEKISETNEEEADEDQNSDEKMEVDPDPVEDPKLVKEVEEDTEKSQDQEKTTPTQEEEAESDNSESKKKVISKPAYEDHLRIAELERRERREREEAELYASVLSEQKSRSGRRRKPSRFSLDIARLTKRKSGYSSHDEDFLIPSAPSPRGQKRKGILEEESFEKKQKVEKKPEAVDHTSIIPRVFLSLADQRAAQDVMIKKKLLPPRKEEEKKSSEEEDAKKTEKQDTTKEGSENPLDLVAQYFGNSKKSEEKSAEDEKKDEEEEEKKDVEKEESKEKDSLLDTENKAEDNSKDKEDEEKVKTPTDGTEDSKKADDSVAAEPSEVESNDNNNQPISGENPSDILARKLDLLESKKLSSKPDHHQPSTISDFIEEDGDVDNKYRLRKLLQQCSIEEIISVAIPQALNSISIGDFFLYKSGQMSKEKVSYAALYKQLEALHMSVQKESARYTTLLRRANKVGGDRRLDKVILMPIYNKQAADALNINLSSIDAHIGNIQSHPTAQMMAANSFRLNCKMEPPLHRLDLPMLYDYKQARRRPSPRMSDSDGMNMSSFNSPKRWSQQSRPTYSSSARNMSYKPRNVYQQRKTNYMATSSTTPATTSMQSTSMSSRPESQALREQARLQLASRHQSPFDHMKVDNGPVPNTHVSTSDVDQTLGQMSVEGSTANVMTSVVPTTQTIATTGVEDAVAVSAAGAQQQVMMDDGSIVTAEEGKQLVSIGDGQYFELPEGYTLIQTDEGFVIGHPGTQFVQGDDGQVYMTSGEEVSSSDQILATTAGVAESDNADQLLQHLNQN